MFGYGATQVQENHGSRIISHNLVDPKSFDGLHLKLEDVRFISKITGYKEDDTIPYLKAGNKWWTGY